MHTKPGKSSNKYIKLFNNKNLSTKKIIYASEMDGEEKKKMGKNKNLSTYKLYHWTHSVSREIYE
jgi:hypothetical protein